jgi:hypothetical protein
MNADLIDSTLRLRELSSHLKVPKKLDVIAWCTKLLRSNADESVNLEVAWMDFLGDRQANHHHASCP